MRHDHTQWLMHFVRDRNPEQDFPGEDEDEAGRFIGGEIEMDADAFYVLKTVIRLGGLLPGYSFRSERTTIYGGKPALCVTEMPLYSFATYVRSKKDTSKVSAYGLAFLKSEFFAAGGRPAIYGLSIESPKYITNTSYQRIFDPSVLPAAEQYRYVAYSPSGTHWIDWSHEREWRWVANSDDRDSILCKDYDGCIGPTPGLPLFKGKLDGHSFSRVCIIVWTHEEAVEIQELLTGFYLAGSNNYGTELDKQLIRASSIIVLQDVIDAVEKDKDLDAQTIEGLEAAKLVKPIVIASPPEGAAELVELAFAQATAAGKAAAEIYIKKYGGDGGDCGFAHAVTYDVTHPIVQYLIAEKLASGPFDGAVWINVPSSWPVMQSIDYEKAIFRVIAVTLSKALCIRVFMESRLD